MNGLRSGSGHRPHGVENRSNLGDSTLTSGPLCGRELPGMLDRGQVEQPRRILGMEFGDGAHAQGCTQTETIRQGDF